MRIISGRFARKQITAPQNLPVRPTTDFAKTGLFNILSNRTDFIGIRALDLFSGTGNISYELYSRGTEQITCVDRSLTCTRFITQTFHSLNAGSVHIVTSDVIDYLAKCTKTYDLIFADPPYEYKDHNILLEAVFSKKLLSKNGTFVLEHGSITNLAESIFFEQERKYGSVHFSFFVNPGE